MLLADFISFHVVFHVQFLKNNNKLNKYLKGKTDRLNLSIISYTDYVNHLLLTTFTVKCNKQLTKCSAPQLYL